VTTDVGFTWLPKGIAREAAAEHLRGNGSYRDLSGGGVHFLSVHRIFHGYCACTSVFCCFVFHITIALQGAGRPKQNMTRTHKEMKKWWCAVCMSTCKYVCAKTNTYADLFACTNIQMHGTLLLSSVSSPSANFVSRTLLLALLALFSCPTFLFSFGLSLHFSQHLWLS